MKNYRYLSGLLILLMMQTACVTTLEEDDSFADSSVDVFSGNAGDMIDQYSENWYPFPFEIQKFSYEVLESEPLQHRLNIKVTYGGGEGCPKNLFVLQWDGQILEPEPGKKEINLGLARFLNSEFSCEALVTETLVYNLRDLVGDQIDELNNPIFKVNNLIIFMNIKTDL